MKASTENLKALAIFGFQKDLKITNEVHNHNSSRFGFKT